MSTIAKQQSCQKYILKIHSRRLRKSNWNLNITLKEARENSEIISLMDSTALRWIDEINEVSNIDDKVKEIHKEIKKIRQEDFSVDNRKKIKEKYTELDNLQFHPDYMGLIIDKLKDFYYANQHGFTINYGNNCTKHYRRLIGTNGGVKNSTVIYVTDSIYQKLSNRLDNGHNPNIPQVPAKFESYKALTCSGSIPVSDPDGVLVVNDCVTHFKSDIIRIDDEADGEPILTHEKDQDVELVDSDGYGLITTELSEKWHNELLENGICSGFCIRNSFCKGMVFTFPYKEFAEKIAHQNVVKDAWGNEVDINNVSLILTTSMLKLWNCYKSWDDYWTNCKNNHYCFSVTKCCPNQLENERTLNYQFLQSYRLNDSQLAELLQPTIDEINDVLGGDYRKSILFLKGMFLNDDNVENIDCDFAKALMIDKRMINDPFVKSKIHQMIRKRINEAKIGKLKVHANFSIISGDPYSLCQSIFGMEVTGLLKSGEAYNRYWNDYGADKVVCFRAPMTCHNNIRILHMADELNMRYWYRYMTTCTILNSWDTTTHALNGADKDSDQVFLTDNKILLENTRELPAIMCIQRKADKVVVTEDDLIKANKNSFGDEIGKTTNRITIMIDLQSKFDINSAEYKVLDYRIMCGQLYQQNAIDKTKGIIAKPMPKEWYNADLCTIKDDDTEDIKKEKSFNAKIVANKKPYFMCYVYKDTLKRYKDYIDRSNCKTMIKFRMTLDDLLHKSDKTEAEQEFIDYYYKCMPVGIEPCLLNRICWNVENEFDNYLSQNIKYSKFDYSLLKSDYIYSKTRYNQIKKLYQQYMKELNDYHTYSANQRIEQEEATTARMEFKNRFIQACDEACPNEYELCNIVVDMCYQRRNTKQFAWDICGKTMIQNLLNKNNHTINYPVQCEDGDIYFGGNRFNMYSKNIGDDDI